MKLWYLKGSRSKGKEYNEIGNVKYDGEFLNGEYNGFGREYNYKGNLIYEGGYLNGRKNGKGKSFQNGK